MTKKNRKAQKWRPKRGIPHKLDMAASDLDLDEKGAVRRGIAGVFDITYLQGLKLLEAELDWFIEHDTADPRTSPMHVHIDIEDVCRRAKLTDEQREVIVLLFELHSQRQIGELLNISKSAVEHRITWARFKLKLWIDDIQLSGLG